MAKYIDVDYAISRMNEIKFRNARNSVVLAADEEEIIRWLNAMPAADVVRVVRCKDCRFHEDEQIGMVYCPETVGGWVEDNWFCKGGERRDE